LLNHTGVAVAGLNISFLLARHSRAEAMRNFRPLMLKAGKEISAMMGFRE
jgi:DNA-binding IclR family transcriptional regulator